MAPASVSPHFLTLLIASALHGPLGYNINTFPSTIFSSNVSKQFGYQVLQFGEGPEARVIVGAPGEQNATGNVYQCSMQGEECQDVPLEGSSGVSHLGMTLASNAQGSQMIACGPGVPQHCDKNLYVNGVCYLFDAKLSDPQNITTGYEKCLKGNVDLVFLFDGSESMKSEEFNTIKDFMIDVMDKLKNSTIHFAAVQFSFDATMAFDFNDYTRDPNPRKLLANVAHAKSITNTFTAIKFVVDTVFTPEHGMRKGANKVIIIITDGDATDSDNRSIEVAKKRGILRLIIGIGNNFNKTAAQVFASKPIDQFVKVLDSFEQLKASFTDLQSKIYAIEGVNEDTSDSGSFHLELSSSGLSADISQGRVVLGAVGADNWAGGLLEQQKDLASERFITTPFGDKKMDGAYLGYALKFLQRHQRVFYAVGAPRYQHVGQVLLFEVNLTTTNWTLKQEIPEKQEIPQQQIGAYFGAVLCSVDVDNDNETDLLLIGAPQYFTGTKGGRVYMYGWKQDVLAHLGELQGEPGYPLGRFGAAVTDLADISGDGLTDVAVGAPLEDGDAGVVYIYNGYKRTVHTHYSQRIKGASISSGLKFFGQSIHGRTDLSNDGLADVAVGALGEVVVLRSRPIVTVATTEEFSPKEIPVKDVQCLRNASAQRNVEINLRICFNTSLATTKYQGPLSANLLFHLEIDPNRMKNRGLFSNDKKVIDGIQRISVGVVCTQHIIHIQNCIEDYITPIKVFVNFSLEDDNKPNKGNLRPVLNPLSNSTTMEIPFEKNCGTDGVCEANMRILFHDSGSKELIVSPAKELNVVVQLENHLEDAYYVTLHVPHILGLSFRKASVATTIISCNGMLDSADSKGLSCNISHPIFTGKTEAQIQLRFGISGNIPWADTVEIEAYVNSANEKNNTLSNNRASLTIPVRYPINIIVKGLDKSIKYVNFSSQAQENKTVTHSYEVRNLPMGAFPPPEVTVFVNVPSVFPAGLIWKVDSVQTDPAVTCQPVETHRKSKREAGDIMNHSQGIKQCADDKCHIYQCDLGLINSSLIHVTGMVYTTSKIEHSSWSKLDTSLWLTFDTGRYNNFYNIDFQSQVTTDVEMTFEMNYLPVMIGSGIGGLFLLILIIVGLYKCGFFKRNYKDRMDLEEETVSALQDDKPESDKEKEAKGSTDALNGEAESK